MHVCGVPIIWVLLYDEGVVRPLSRLVQGIDAVVDDIHREAGALEPAGDGVGEQRLVLDDQHPHGLAPAFLSVQARVGHEPRDLLAAAESLRSGVTT